MQTSVLSKVAFKNEDANVFRKQKLRKKIFFTDPHKELLKRVVQAKRKMIPDGSTEMLE